MSVFRNLLTQLFDKGELPSEYQRVEWIAGTSTVILENAIDTGIMMEPGIEIIIGASWNQDFNPAYDRLGGFDKLNWIEAGSNNTSITFYQHGTYSSLDSTRKEIKITDNAWYVDNELIRSYSTPVFGDSTIVLCSNTVGQYTYGGRFSIWDCTIKINGELVFNGIPCYLKADEEIGMYDTVSQTFFTSTGEGIFIKGDDI